MKDSAFLFDFSGFVDYNRKRKREKNFSFVPSARQDFDVRKKDEKRVKKQEGLMRLQKVYFGNIIIFFEFCNKELFVYGRYRK